MFGKKKQNPEVTNELTKEDIKQMLSNCTCYEKGKAPKNPWRVESLPEARMRDKYCHDNNIAVMSSTFDPVQKSATIEYVMGVDTPATMLVSYKQLCDNFGWDSFEVSENHQTVYPKWA